MDRTPSRQTAGKPYATMPVSGHAGIDVPRPVNPSERHRAGKDRVTSVTEVMRHLLS